MVIEKDGQKVVLSSHELVGRPAPERRKPHDARKVSYPATPVKEMTPGQIRRQRGWDFISGTIQWAMAIGLPIWSGGSVMSWESPRAIDQTPAEVERQRDPDANFHDLAFDALTGPYTWVRNVEANENYAGALLEMKDAYAQGDIDSLQTMVKDDNPYRDEFLACAGAEGAAKPSFADCILQIRKENNLQTDPALEQFIRDQLSVSLESDAREMALRRTFRVLPDSHSTPATVRRVKDNGVTL